MIRPSFRIPSGVTPWRRMFVACSAAVVAGAAVGCAGGAAEVIAIDGSSTVYPITEAMAEEFGLSREDRVHVTIATSGTGGGFKTFCAGERDINNASRPIKDSEREVCEANGVAYLEVEIAVDGLSVVVNPANVFVQCLTVAELREIWQPGSTVTRWSDVRSEWPDETIRLYGAGTNSGTFDSFTEAIMGRVGAIRPDFAASEDDNVLVQGVEGDRNALGFFGFAYYWENRSRIRAVAVDNGAGCVDPTEATVRDGSYRPLARPLFIYVSRRAWERPIVRDFVRFYIREAPTFVPETGYVPRTEAEYARELAMLDAVPLSAAPQ